jgi:hypothetical protein
MNPARLMARRICVGHRERRQQILNFLKKEKKQGAAGITTAAPYVAGQWGRGDNRLS